MRRWRNADWWLILAVAVLCTISDLILLSGTRTDVPGRPLYFVQRQLLWIGLGIVAMGLVASTDYRQFRTFSRSLYVLGLALLVLVFVHGHSALGAQRWISLGPFDLQPSEFVKLFLALGLADLLANQRRLDRLRDLIRPTLYVALPGLLVLKQPDLGTTLILIGILVVVLFMAGARILHLILVYGGGFSLVVLLIYLHVAKGLPLPLLHSYQLKRLLVFLNPNMDPFGAGYNIIQSQISIASGGITGVGLHSNQAILSFLPSNSTDFIFGVVGLDLGFVGGAALLLMYLIVILRGLNIVSDVPDRFGQLLGIGVTAIIAIHVLMNAGMTMGIMPVVGVPLPFVSYGGSSILTDFLGLGVLLSLKIHKGRIFRA